MNGTRRLLKYNIDKNIDAYFEVDETNFGKHSTKLVSNVSGKTCKEVKKSFDDVIGTIKPVAQKTIEALKGAANIKEIEVEMGVKLDAEAGAIFAKVGAGANISVKLKWINEGE